MLEPVTDSWVDPDAAERAGLSPFQVDVLVLIARHGATTPEIAAGLHVPPDAVKTLLSRAYERAGVSCRAGWVTWAFKRGVLVVPREVRPPTRRVLGRAS